LTPLSGLLLAAVAVLAPAPATAHSLLVGATPAAGSVVTTPPLHLNLRFNNRIEKRLSRVRLVDERGAVATALIEAGVTDAPDSVTARLPPLAPGAWRVEWQVFSTDGHVVSGSYGFRLAP
jgi:copper resistance protein C